MLEERKDDGTIGDLFAEGIIDRLSEIILAASPSSATRTVREVVGEISKYLGLKGWKYPDGFI